MNVERVFSVKGYGTVVTGIPLSGQIRLGEKAVLDPFPTGPRELTVRTVQTYKYASDMALARCCCAINVREIDAALITRGMTLASPNIFTPTTQLLVTLENATDGPTAAPFKRRFPARLHTGTAAVEVAVKLLEIPDLQPSHKGFAHLILSEPLVIAAGDRYLLRSLSPALTLGGGVVLSARSQRLRRNNEIITRLQQAQTLVTQGDMLGSELLAGPSALLSNAEALRLTQCPAPHNQTLLAQAAASGLIVELPGGEYAITSRMDEVCDVMEKLLERYHRTHLYVYGMQPTQVCETLGVSPKSFSKLAELLAKSGKIALRHNHLALATFKPHISERLMKLREQILQVIAQSGVNAPARGNLMKDLAIPEPDMKVLEKLLTSQSAVVVLDGNFMSQEVYKDCRDKLLALFAQTPIVDLSAYRDALQSNRKMAVALLDAFDAEGLTRRVPEGRMLKQRPTPAF